MIARREAGLLLAAFVAGCGPMANGPQERALLNAPSVRPVPFGALPVTQVGFPSSTFFLLDHKSPVLDLGNGGRSFAACVALPPQAGDLRVSMRSFVIGGRFFYPVATLLDETMSPFHASAPADYATLRPGLDYPTRASSVVKSMLVAGPTRHRARYLVIHTTRALMEPEPAGQLLAFPRGAEAARSVSAVPDAGLAPRSAGGAVGDVLLELRPSLL